MKLSDPPLGAFVVLADGRTAQITGPSKDTPKGGGRWCRPVLEIDAAGRALKLGEIEWQEPQQVRIY